MMMVCIQVFGADVSVAMGGAEGNFQLNTFRPMMIYNTLRSARLIADASEHFRRFMIDGTELNEVVIGANVGRSAMLVTALSPLIGYVKAAAIAHHAIEHDLTLREAALAHDIAEELFDEVVSPLDMTRPTD
jgi:fumarate hydratase class II